MGVCRSYSETKAPRTGRSAENGPVLSVRVADRPERLQEIRNALLDLGCQVETRRGAAEAGGDERFAEEDVVLIRTRSAEDVPKVEARLNAIGGVRIIS